MLDCNRLNEFSVIVDGRKLEERPFHDGRTYIIMPLFCSVSYGVEFLEEIKTHGKVETVSQRWPVCPYTVSVSNRSSKGNFASLYVDGQKVAERYVREGKSITFEGVPTEQGIQELLFSLPRYATVGEKETGGRSLPDSKASELGTIKIVWKDCVETGSSLRENRRRYYTSSFKQANKHDASATGSAQAALAAAGGASSGGGAGKFASTTRAGKIVGLNEGRTCMVTNYQYVGQPWSACLHYRTQEYLEELGVVDPLEMMTEEEKAERLANRQRKRQRRRAKSKAERGADSGPPPVTVLEAHSAQPVDNDLKHKSASLYS